MEQGILLPVEEAISGIQGIKEIVSTAREGSGEIAIEFIAGTNRMKAFQDIDQAVSRIRTFPDDIEQPQGEPSVAAAGCDGNKPLRTGGYLDPAQLGEQLRNILLSNPGDHPGRSGKCARLLYPH